MTPSGPSPVVASSARDDRDWRARLEANQRWLREWLRGFGGDPESLLWPPSPPERVAAVEQVMQARPLYARELALVDAWFLEARDAMVRALRARHVPPDAREDIAQEAMTRALETLPRLTRAERPLTETDLRRWMFGILEKVRSEHHRKALREAPSDALGDTPTWRGEATAAAALAQLSPAFFDALEALPAPQRGAWLAVDLEDGDLHALALVTGCPYQTVCSHLKLARRRLADALRHHR